MASSAVRAGYLFAQSAKLSDQVAAVEAVFASLVRPSSAFAAFAASSLTR